MGQCLFKTAHSCGTTDALQVFEKEDGSVDGFCYACKTYVPDPLGGKTIEDFPVKKRLKKSKEEIEAEIKEIRYRQNSETCISPNTDHCPHQVLPYCASHGTTAQIQFLPRSIDSCSLPL